MSVVFPIEEDSRYRSYTATAGQTVFSVPFPFQQNEDIQAQKTPAAGGDPVALSLTTDFTLTGKGSASGGSLTLVAAAAVGDVIEIWGQAIIDRTSSVVQGGKFSSTSQDNEYDRSRIIAQEQARDIGRALKVPLGMNGMSVEKLAEGHFYLTDANGNLVDGGTGAQISGAQAYAETAATKATEAATSAADAAALADAFENYGYLADWGSITEAPGEILDYGDITA